MRVITRFPFLSWLFAGSRPISVHQVTLSEERDSFDTVAEFVTLHTCDDCGHKHSVRMEGIGPCRTCGCQHWRR